MATIDTRPSDVDLIVYAGDTLTLNILSPDYDYSTWMWTGHIKTTQTSSVIDAEFTFTHGEPPSGSQTFAVLSAQDSADLGGPPAALVRSPNSKSGPVVTPLVIPALYRYSGVWDIQVENAGTVVTLARGTIKVDTDITRV